MKEFMIEDLKRHNHLFGEMDAAYHEAALKLGLSDSAMRILYAICNEGTCCPLSDICKMSGISKQTINSALRKLEQEEIIYLENYQGRKKMVHLTENGLKLVDGTVARVIQIENEIFESWTVEERKQFLELTQRFLDAFKDKSAQL